MVFVGNQSGNQSGNQRTWRTTLFGVGLGLILWMGGAAHAADTENGEAEAAPPEAAAELAAGHLVTAPAPDPVNPARIVAHTAQLPKAKAGSGGKPLFPAELPRSLSGPSPAAAPSAPSTGPAAAPRPDDAAATPVQIRPAARSAAANKAGAVGPARRVRLPLAPSAAEIRREIATRNGGPLPSASQNANSAAASSAGAGRDKPSLGSRLEERATAAPKQNPRWPTHVDYSAGPTGPAGGNTAGDRKGALIEATGPQQGVIRNRW